MCVVVVIVVVAVAVNGSRGLIVILVLSHAKLFRRLGAELSYRAPAIAVRHLL